MKKSLFTALILSLLATLGTAFAAGTPSASHDVTIKIPELLSLRIIGTSGNSAAVNPAVDFDFVTDPQLYIDKLAAGGGTLEPTSTSEFTNVIVLSNKVDWIVNVKAATMGSAAQGITEGDISILPSTSSATVAAVVATRTDVTLSTSDQEIATGTQTKGWAEIGVAGADYRLAVQGDEAPGTYTTVVTYTVIAKP